MTTASIYYQKNWQRAFGTFPLTGTDLENALNAALDVGYRAIDTAQMYGNEQEVGDVLQQCGIDRSELCITTKVQHSNFTVEDFLPSVESSLSALQLDYVDVLLLHWPPANGQIDLPLQLLSQAVEKGYTKNIGVSNFTAAMLRHTRKVCELPIVTNQVEFHPLLDQSVLLAASAETGIPLSSYCSVARGEVLKNPLLAGLAENYGVTAAQIALRWILQKGVSVNTMSTNPENIRSNYEVMDFTLSNVDMEKIDALGSTNFRVVAKSKVPWAPDFD